MNRILVLALVVLCGCGGVDGAEAMFGDNVNPEDSTSSSSSSSSTSTSSSSGSTTSSSSSSTSSSGSTTSSSSSGAPCSMCNEVLHGAPAVFCKPAEQTIFQSLETCICNGTGPSDPTNPCYAMCACAGECNNFTVSAACGTWIQNNTSCSDSFISCTEN